MARVGVVGGDGAPRVPNLLFVTFSLSGVGGGGGANDVLFLTKTCFSLW